MRRTRTQKNSDAPRPWLPLLVAWAATLLAYSNSFSAPLLYDSKSAIVQDPRVWVATPENVAAIVSEDYWYRDRSSGLYRPLTKLSYLFNYAVLGSGADPGSYHLVNFVLHLANVALVYALALLLLGDAIAAAAVAALWGVHPVLTECVTNVVGRADLLAGFGVLAGLLCYIRSAATGKRRWLSGLMAAAAIGIFSKESAIALPVGMLLYDATFGGAPWRRRLAGYAAAGLPFVAYLIIRWRVSSALIDTNFAGFVQNPEVGAGFWTARLTALEVIGRLILLLAWPMRLSVDYSYNQIPLATGVWAAAAVLGLCLVIASLAVCYRRKRAAFFFVAFSFAALLPSSNLVIPIGSIMALRFLYLPSIGLIAAAIMSLAAWAPARGRLATIAAVLALALAARTYARNLDWNNDTKLWTSAVEACPNSYMTHLGLASVWMSMSSADPAAVDRELDRSLAIIDSLPDDRNLTAPYSIAGTWYRTRAAGAAPDAALEWNRRAVALLERGRRIDAVNREAVRRLNVGRGKSVDYYTPWPAVYLELGRAYLQLSEPRKALDAFTYGRLATRDATYSLEIANAWRALGDSRQAAIALFEGYALDPSRNALLRQLPSLYKEIDPQGCAVRIVGERSALDLHCPIVHDDFCAASKSMAQLYLQAGMPGEAAELKNRAIAGSGCAADLFR